MYFNMLATMRHDRALFMPSISASPCPASEVECVTTVMSPGSEETTWRLSQDYNQDFLHRDLELPVPRCACASAGGVSLRLLHHHASFKVAVHVQEAGKSGRAICLMLTVELIQEVLVHLHHCAGVSIRPATIHRHVGSQQILHHKDAARRNKLPWLSDSGPLLLHSVTPCDGTV